MMVRRNVSGLQHNSTADIYGSGNVLVRPNKPANATPEVQTTNKISPTDVAAKQPAQKASNPENLPVPAKMAGSSANDSLKNLIHSTETIMNQQEQMLQEVNKLLGLERFSGAYK